MRGSEMQLKGTKDDLSFLIKSPMRFHAIPILAQQRLSFCNMRAFVFDAVSRAFPLIAWPLSGIALRICSTTSYESPRGSGSGSAGMMLLQTGLTRPSRRRATD